MRFNADKSQIVAFERRPDSINADYYINGLKLTLLDSFKYLGVIISDDFKWDIYIDTTARKAHQKLGMIRRTLPGAPFKLISYLALCRPVMEHASEAWNQVLCKLVDKLERVQKQAM